MPFIIYTVLILVIDPFNYFAISDIIPYQIKNLNSRTTNYTLWKTIEFSRDPNPNIFLGDSRVAGLETKSLEKFSGLAFYDFAYGGGTIEESINTFWFANSKCKLQNVFLGLNFNVYNGYDIRDRVESAKDILHNPFLYIINKDVLDAAYSCTVAFINNNYESPEKPNMSKSVFWRYKITEAVNRYFAVYSYPKYYYNQLREISEYCKNNGINLVFMIMPEHQEVLDLIKKYELNNEYNKFISDVSSLSETYNFNLINSITSNKENFKDPFHIKNSSLTFLLSHMWIQNSKRDSAEFYIHSVPN